MNLSSICRDFNTHLGKMSMVLPAVCLCVGGGGGGGK